MASQKRKQNKNPSNNKKKKITYDELEQMTLDIISDIEKKSKKILISSDVESMSIPNDLLTMVDDMMFDIATGIVPSLPTIHVAFIPYGSVNNFRILLNKELYVSPIAYDVMQCGGYATIMIFTGLYNINFTEGYLLPDGNIIYPITDIVDNSIVNILIYYPNNVNINSIYLEYKLIPYIKKKNGFPILKYVEPDTPNYKNIYTLGINRSFYNIISVHEIINPLLSNMYKTLKTQLKHHRLSFTDREITGFYGTNWINMATTITMGFNRSYSFQPIDAPYGNGIYFGMSANECISKQYTVPDENGIMTIIVAKVFVGKSIAGTRGLTTLPIATDGFIYDSTTDSIENPSCYCIFREYQAYPIALVRLKIK